MFLRELAESSWFAYNKEQYFDAHRALYTDTLTYHQSQNLLSIFGRASAEWVLQTIIHHMMAIAFLGGVVGFLFVFTHVLGDKPSVSSIVLVLEINLGLYALLVVHSGVLMAIVGWVVWVGVRRGCR